MKSALSHYVALLACAGFAGSALAAGIHPGGHDHVSASIGKPGDAAAVNRNVNIIMSDNMRFTPSSIKVKGGETIRFVLKNKGRLEHEMVLGTAKELKQHAEAMKKNPGMEHNDPNQVSVEPGKTKELIWQFTQTGTVDFACLEPGHMEAGMVGRVRVAGVMPAKNTSAGVPKKILVASTAAAAAVISATTPIVESADSVANELTDGEVKKIDKENGKITLKHGEIKKFDMPPMSMVFQVKDAAMLDKLKVGDKVRFGADRINNAFVVTTIELR
ncbi:MAG: copper-binding protein [Burkholderiales bacterium]